MKRRIRVLTFGVAAGIMLAAQPVLAEEFAASEMRTQSQSDELQMEIGGSAIDIQQLAEQNGVDPYELKEAIVIGIDAEKASPFSDLEVNEVNTSASQSQELVIVDGAVKTKATKTNQDSTAYVAKSGALTASGKTPEVGMCAMDIDVTTKTGETTASKVKLGTRIYIDGVVYVNGDPKTSFAVEDRGNPSNRTDFWIDVYFGQYKDTTSDTYKAAINYGIQTVSYSYYY